jgi:adenylate cyclase, class 2
MADEIEIKFVIRDLKGLESALRELHLNEQTPRTHEMNTLYDHLGRLRNKGAILRIRKYGHQWVLTHKAKAKDGRHKSRVETETKIDDGQALETIFEGIGYKPTFRYEKFRSEWTDGKGHVVLDETPIGNFGEIEGKPEWIDRIARQIHLTDADYITRSYIELFRDWAKKNRSKARNMTFEEVGREANL